MASLPLGGGGGGGGLGLLGNGSGMGGGLQGGRGGCGFGWRVLASFQTVCFLNRSQYVNIVNV